MATWSPRGKIFGDAQFKRPFVLIGHSQGSPMLQLLIANVIEKDPAVAARMKLPSSRFDLCAARQLVADVKKTPLCTAKARLAGVISWTSFARRTSHRGRDLRHLRPARMTVGCVNPARPAHATGFRSTVTGSPLELPVPGGNSVVERGPATDPYLHATGLVSPNASTMASRGYLWIRDQRRSQGQAHRTVSAARSPSWACS